MDQDPELRHLTALSLTIVGFVMAILIAAFYKGVPGMGMAFLAGSITSPALYLILRRLL